MNKAQLGFSRRKTVYSSLTASSHRSSYPTRTYPLSRAADPCSNSSDTVLKTIDASSRRRKENRPDCPEVGTPARASSTVTAHQWPETPGQRASGG
jgi:hypothetical protein